MAANTRGREGEGSFPPLSLSTVHRSLSLSEWGTKAPSSLPDERRAAAAAEAEAAGG